MGGEYLDTASGVDEAGWLVTGDVGFLADAGRRYAPSMRRVLDLPRIYASAVAVTKTMTYRTRPPGKPPEVCPFTLDALLVPAPGLPDLDALLGALDRASSETG